MNQQQRAVLHGSGLFAGIQPDQIDGMLSCLNARQEHYERNTVVWNIGDTLHACALVLSGALRAESVNASGEHLRESWTITQTPSGSCHWKSSAGMWARQKEGKP